MFDSVRERPQGTFLVGLLLGGVVGCIGLVIALVVARRRTTEGAVVGFVGRLGLMTVVVVVAGLLEGPQTVADDACACSFTLDGGMRHGALDDEYGDASFTAGNLARELYLLDVVVSKSEMWPIPLGYVADDYLDELTQVDGVRVILSPRETTIGGRPARQAAYIGSEGGVTAYQLATVIESPTSFHFVHAWTLASRRVRNEDLLRAVVASFEAHDSAEGDAWLHPLYDAPLSSAREGVEPARLADPWPKSPAPRPPARILRRVRFDAPLGRNVAYLTPDPRDGQRHPAVLWAHGGFGGIGEFLWEPAPEENDQSARAFREAGLVLMLPSWRAENDNPGDFEQFFGEVDDLLAARDHLASLPYVDPDRIYLAGHSTGGTMTLLAAASTDAFRAAFSIGGAPSMVGVTYGREPYEPDEDEQIALRSAILFTPSIRRPTFYFAGASEEGYLADALAMQAIAGARDVPFRAWSIDGHDHFTVVHPVTHGIAQKILADGDVSRPFRLTDAEVQRWFEAPAAP